MTAYRGIKRHYESHGRGRDPIYRVWQSMIQRCTNPKATKFELYGGRGVGVCERWSTSFVSFLSDMGERPAGMSIDRIDPNGDYEPGNCRWATITQQRSNQRPPKLELHEHAQIVWLKSLGYSTREISRFFDIDPTYTDRIVRRANQSTAPATP